MTKEQIKRALEIGEEEMCSPEMIENGVFCREFMTPAMEALREIDQLMDSMEKRQPNPKELLRELIERTREQIEDKTEIIQLTLERDAAIEDIFNFSSNKCFCCAHNTHKWLSDGGMDDLCKTCLENGKCNWVWRGVRKEER